MIEHITFRKDLRTLHADLYHADGDWAALILHGWTGYRGGSAGALARRLVQNGVSCLCLDQPGHGDSDGIARLVSKQGFVRAAGAAYDQLAERVPGRKMLIVGTSFGGYVAARLIATRHADALALRVPANYEPFDQALKAVSDFQRPVFVLEAEDDEVIPPEMVAQYIEAASQAEHCLLWGAPHSISTVPAKLDESNELLAQWLRSVAMDPLDPTTR